MSTENEHRGAEDRATQRVSWWIGGNYNGPGGDGESICRQWEAMTAEAFDAAQEDHDDNETPMDEAIDAQVYQLSEQLKIWLDGAVDDEDLPSGSLIGDLLDYMVACVDWQQLAKDALEQRQIETAGA